MPPKELSVSRPEVRYISHPGGDSQVAPLGNSYRPKARPYQIYAKTTPYA